MKRLSLYAAVWAVCAVLAGCATDLTARLNTGAKIHAATTRTVRQSLDAQLISSQDAQVYEAIAINSSEILDSARDLKDSDPSTAEGKAKLANDILGELQQFLVRLQRKATP